MHLPPPAFRVFQNVQRACEREDLIPQDGIIVAGVSGGVDSMLMLDFLRRIRVGFPFHLFVCHVNHMIRSGEADLDERLVQVYCRKYDLPFRAFKVDVPAFSREERIGLEEAGRRLRRECYAKVGEEAESLLDKPSGYRVALAHHLDDRAESIVMHMGRGTGLGGLAGIRWREGPYIRPLLGLRRNEVEAAARAMDLAWREDPSNLSDQFLRNRIRNRLLPLWEEVFGHDPAPLLVRLGHLAEEDDRELSDQALRYLEASLLPDGSLSLSDFERLSRPLASRVIQLFAQKEGGPGRQPYPLSHSQIDAILDLCHKVRLGEKTSGKLDLPGQQGVLISEGRITLTDKAMDS